MGKSQKVPRAVRPLQVPPAPLPPPAAVPSDTEAGEAVVRERSRVSRRFGQRQSRFASRTPARIPGQLPANVQRPLGT